MLFVLAILLSLAASRAPAQSTRPFLTGVDANYSLDMEKRGKTWSTGGKPGDLFAILKSAGVDTMRIRLWTGDDGANGLTYATEVARRSQAAGIKPYVVIFLSENWADMVKQPAPAIWKDLTPAAKLTAIEAYTERVAKHFADAKIDVDLFEIGNEIDFGLCGEFEEEWSHRVSIEYMRQTIWPKVLPMILAAEAGVKKARPNAKFILHLAQWNNPDYCIAFHQFMLAGGAQLDYAGLSYFPTAAAKPEERTLDFLKAQIDKITAAVHKPVILCESGYPTAANFPGQFAEWNKPVEGYTLDEPGQQKWIKDYFAAARNNPNIAGVFCWSPEWYDSEMWSAFSLFDGKGNARLGLGELKK